MHHGAVEKCNHGRRLTYSVLRCNINNGNSNSNSQQPTATTIASTATATGTTEAQTFFRAVAGLWFVASLAVPLAPCCQRLCMTISKGAGTGPWRKLLDAERWARWPGFLARISIWPSCGRLISPFSLASSPVGDSIPRQSYWLWLLIADYMASYNFIALGLSPKWPVTECEQFNKECGLVNAIDW